MPLVAGNLYYIWCSFIEPPHEKISICVCPTSPYFFWVSSQPRSHGIGQVLLPAGITNGIDHDSYADLSTFKMASQKDVLRARDFGPIEAAAKALILATLNNPIETLAEKYRLLALQNLT